MNSASLKHLSAILERLKPLEPPSVELFEPTYEALAFGGWALVAGRREERLRFVWDGKESYLSVYSATFPESRAVAAWKEAREHFGSLPSSEAAIGEARSVLSATNAAWSAPPPMQAPQGHPRGWSAAGGGP